MPELPDARDEQFAKLIVGKMRPGHAWLAAGFEAKTARLAGNYGNLKRKRLKIAARIAELEVDVQLDVLKHSAINRESVLAGLQVIIDMGTGAKPFITDDKGNEIFKPNLTAAARAHELQGKELGMFADRLIVQDLDAEIKGMTAEELRQYAVGTCTQLGLRVVEMSDDQLHTFIIRNCERVGLSVAGPGVDGAEAAEDAGVPPVPEAGGVPPGRAH